MIEASPLILNEWLSIAFLQDFRSRSQAFPACRRDCITRMARKNGACNPSGRVGVTAISRVRNRREPLYPQHMMKAHPALFSGALKEFGKWSKALRSFGVPTIQESNTPRLRILRALRDLRESHSEKKVPPKLKREAEYYFGSLLKAIAESKKDRRIVNGWSKPKIITILSRMHRRNEVVNYSRCRRDLLLLVSSAQAYFGSWGKALHQAGVDPNLYFVHNKWRKATKKKSIMNERSF